MEVSPIAAAAFANPAQAVVAVRATTTKNRSQKFGSNTSNRETPTSKRVPVDLIAEKIANSLTRAIPDMDPDVAIEIAKRAVFSRDEAVAATENRRGSQFIEDQLGTQLDVTA